MYWNYKKSNIIPILVFEKYNWTDVIDIINSMRIVLIIEATTVSKNMEKDPFSVLTLILIKEIDNTKWVDGYQDIMNQGQVHSEVCFINIFVRLHHLIEKDTMNACFIYSE